jgi:site-specific recombinase XerD
MEVWMMNQSSFNLNINGQSTLMPAILAWEVYLRDQSKSFFTIRSFVGDLHLLAAFLPLDKTISEITTSDLNRFLEWVKEGRGRNIPCSPKSFSRRITSIKSFFRWLKKFSVISVDPAETILQHSVISPLPEVLSPLEEKMVLDAALKIQTGERPDLRPYLLLKLLLETGIKKSECLNLSVNHINSEAKEPYLFIRYTDAKDRNKERKINISHEWLQVLDKFLENKPDSDSLFPWSPRRLEYLLEDIGKEAGIHKHLSFSMCRWTSAMNDIKRGQEPDSVRQKMGVSKIQWRELQMKLKQLISQVN